MEQLNDYHIKYAKQWFDFSIEAVKSHRQKEKGKQGFIQTSKNTKLPEGRELFPTASFQAYSSLFNCSEGSEFYEEFDTIISKGIKEYTRSSENSSSRSIILFEPILSCLLLRGNRDINLDKIKELILGKDIEEQKKREEYFYPEVGQSPWFLLSLLTCNDYVKKLCDKNEDININRKLDELNTLIDNHINYHMARYNVKELSFDPISLIIAICCKIKIDETNKFKKSPFFLSCLKAIVSQQNNDGSWPTGATISFSESGDVIQQTSIQITSYLAESIIDYKFLVDSDEDTENILDVIIPSFRKLAQYMVSTYVAKTEANTSGWSSDRTKIKNFTETWITAYACRFFYKYYLAEKAYARIKALKALGVPSFIYDPQDDGGQKRWDEIIDPDSILTPKEEIEIKIVNPIIEKREKGALLINPVKNNLSFIICGPPGSGKTYIVESMAKKIGWPLVELSPSQFIKKGLEFIESESKEIFNHLFLLHQAVVFFDECDELFKERDNKDEKNATRTILNFLTASMLPKLQKLHDNGNIIFVVGTNFLQNIDKAIRREGRFDYLILYDRPDYEVREEYYLEKKGANMVEEAKKFTKRTEMCCAKDLNKYLKGTKTVPTDDDYIEWCMNIAEKEIEATRYTPTQKNRKKKQWKSLVANNRNKNQNDK